MNSSNDGITMSRGSWIRFSSEILNRWAGLKSKPSIELIKIGNNTREKRLERGYTLEELSEILTWKVLGLEKNNIYIVNLDGYFNNLIKQFNKKI